jgi:non-specific serine/threonine protein kinase
MSPQAPTTLATLVLHACWADDGNLMLWAEDGARINHALPSPSVHPFAATPDGLKTVLGLSKAEAAASTGETVAMWLPTANGRPQAAPGLRPDAPPSPTGARRAWQVPVRSLPMAIGLPVLARLLAAGGVRLGPSLRFLAQVRRFVDVLATRGEIRPRLEERDGRFHAVWRAVIVSAATTRLRDDLIATLPASLLAHLEPARSGRDAADAVVTDVTDAMADAVARPMATTTLPPIASATTAAERAAIAWAKALGPDGPEIAVSAKAIADLAKALGSWPANASSPAVPTGPGLRLVPPLDPESTDERPWQLQILQSLPAGRGGQAVGAKQVLWKAAKVFAPLNRALEGATASGVRLTGDEALDFLTRGATALRAAGFHVEVPDWRRSPGDSLSLRLQSEVRKSPRGPMCRFQWQASLGGQPLTDQQVRRMAGTGSPWLIVDGAWVAVDPADRRQALATMAATGLAGDLPVQEILRRTMTESAGLTGAADLGWLQRLLQPASASLQPVDAPKALHAVLRDYQRRGLDWLSFMSRTGLGACLADDMGLGKTIQVLALLLAEREAPEAPGPTLLICPTSVVGNWQREAARFAPSLRVLIHHGSERAEGGAFAKSARQHDLVVTTYGLAVNDAATLNAVAWHRLVLDEAQMVKNAGTKQHQAIAGLKAYHRLALTGTPIENRLSDLWALMNLLNPGVLGSQTDFDKRFAQPIERRQDGDAAAELRRLTGPFILRRVKTDPAIARDLPEKLEFKTYCTLTPEQATLYQTIVDDLMQHLGSSGGMTRRGHVLAALTKLKQVCDHPVQVLSDEGDLSGRSGKLARLEEMLDEVLACGEKALIFTQFATWADRLGDHLARRFDRETLVLTGGTSREARDRMIERFAKVDGPSLFVLSLKAGGTGLNLMAANHVFHVDRWWNPAVEAQATDRAFRIGQRRNVLVRQMICAGTVEERIDALLEAKRDLADRIISEGEAWLTELSTDEIRDLVRLAPDAVVAG